MRALALWRAEPKLVFQEPKNNFGPTAGEATGPVFVSESGISDPATVRQLREAGYRGFLMGENFMKQPDPGAALADFIQAI